MPANAKYRPHADLTLEERADAQILTEAALDYIKSINRDFDGNWLPTLAAYNVGTVRFKMQLNAISHAGRPIEFSKLHLP